MKLEIQFNKMQEAISVMKEVALWGRQKCYRVWPDEWLTPEELLSKDVLPENFCIGTIEGETACAFLLQWTDSEYWPDAPAFEAAYLHKLCVRRSFAGMGMTGLVRNTYLKAGFKIVHILDYPNGRSMALYELEV